MKRLQIHTGLVIYIAVISCTPTVDSIDFTVKASFGSDSQNGASTWAVNIPSLTFTFRTTNFPTSTAAIVTVIHRLQDGAETAMCQIQLTGTTYQCNTCSPQPENLAVSCNRPIPTTIEFIVTLGGLDSSRNLSKLLLRQGSVPSRDWNYDSDSTLTTLKVCDLNAFERAVADDNSACDYNCNRGFSCSPPVYTGSFSRTCTALATWNDVTNGCSLACNAASLGSHVEPVDNTIVGAGGNKMFNCKCPQSNEASLRFERTCGTDGNWINEGSFCESVCSAADITCGTLVQSNNPNLLCGGQDYEFSCSTACPGAFNLHCDFDGNWNSTDCYCPQVCSAGYIRCATLVPSSSQTQCGGQDYKFSCNTACPISFNLQCEFNGNWNSTDCYCPQVCSVADIKCGTLVQSNDQILCGGQDYEFSCSTACPGTFSLQCNFDGTWDSTDCYCPQVCSAADIKCGTLAQSSSQTLLCGGQNYEFYNTICPGTFNRQCYFDGTWNSTDCYCPQDCALTDGQVAAIIVAAIFTFVFVILIYYCYLKENCCFCMSKSLTCCCYWSVKYSVCVCVYCGFELQFCNCPCSKKGFLTFAQNILVGDNFVIYIAASCLFTIVGIALLAFPTECSPLGAKGIIGLVLAVVGLFITTFLDIILIAKKIGENRPVKSGHNEDAAGNGRVGRKTKKQVPRLQDSSGLKENMKSKKQRGLKKNMKSKKRQRGAIKDAKY